MFTRAGASARSLSDRGTPRTRGPRRSVRTLAQATAAQDPGPRPDSARPRSYGGGRGGSDGFDAYLDQVLIGGREPVEIVICDYDPCWPMRFEAERERIGTAIGDVALSVEHIGSTAVPGLAAKPIIDILVTVAGVEPDDSFRARLEAAGYVLRVRESEHRMFRAHLREKACGRSVARHEPLCRGKVGRDRPDRRASHAGSEPAARAVEPAARPAQASGMSRETSGTTVSRLGGRSEVDCCRDRGC